MIKKKKRIIIGGIVVMVIIIGAGLFGITKDIEPLKALPIDPVNISGLHDGTYYGKYEFSRWNSEVSVTIKSGKIISIERLSEPLTPDVSKRLFDQMIEEQKVDVDTVTGATATSKAYIKSVENALNKNDK